MSIVGNVCKSSGLPETHWSGVLLELIIQGAHVLMQVRLRSHQNYGEVRVVAQICEIHLDEMLRKETGWTRLKQTIKTITWEEERE